MSNVLRNNFFTVPRELVDGGHLATLSGCAVKLYIALMMLAQKHSAVEIEIPAYIAHDLAGLAANSVTSATKELVAAGLVTCRAGQHGRKGYILLDPKTRFPIPAPAGHKGIFCPPPRTGQIMPKGRKSSTAPHEIVIPSWDEIGKTGDARSERDRMNCEPSGTAESQQLRTTIPRIANQTPKNCGARSVEPLEMNSLIPSSSSLKTSLKKEVSEEEELSRAGQNILRRRRNLPSCRNCGGYALYREGSGETICQTCEAIQ